MKLLPCARKMSATSTVGRLTLLFSVGGSVCYRVRKSEERRWGYGSLADDAGINGGKLSSPPNRSDRAVSESFSDPSHAPIGGLPNCGAANADTPFSGFPHGALLRKPRSTPFLN